MPCDRAVRHLVAERETVSCDFQEAAQTCRKLHELLKEKMVFALKLTGEPLPHGKEIRLECGGLQGIRKALGAEEGMGVSKLVLLSMEIFGDLDSLPYPEIVKSVSSYEPRPRRK